MIGAAATAVTELVVRPLTLESVPERVRLALDVDQVPIDATAQTVEVVAGRTRPGPREVGAGVIRLVHEVVVIVSVLHGNPAEAITRRDDIALELILRYELADWHNGDPLGPDERVELTSWVADYSALEVDTLTEYLTLTCTISTERAASL